MKLEEAIKHAINGDALLFLGSGFSVGAKPIKGDAFLTGRQLATYFYKECGISPPDDDLNYATQRYRKHFPDDQLVEELQQLFTATEVSTFHERFSDIKWRGIYTTNYDDVLERAFSNKKKKLLPVTPDKDAHHYTSKKNLCVHINGFINDLTPEALNNSFKLTNTSYLTESFSASNWSFLFRKSLHMSRAVIFIGYSLYDLDIQRILFASDELINKTIFIERDDKKLTDFEGSVQKDFGSIEPIGLSGFWKKFDEVSSTYLPQEKIFSLFSFEELKVAETVREFRDDHVFDLLLKGEPNLEFIMDAVLNTVDRKYFITRENHNKIISHIESGERNVVVYSDMANGKSLFLAGLACALISKGYRAFWLRDDAEDIWEDTNHVTSLNEPTVVVIENYTRRLDDLKYIHLRRNANLVLLMSVKGAFHETGRNDLDEALSNASTIEICLDKLTKDEVISLNGILNTYKLWGERDSWGESKKEHFIRSNCESEISATLLEIVKSPDIQARFSALFKAFQQDDKLTDIVVTASVLKLLGFNNVPEYMVSELTGSSYLYSMDFKRNSIVKQLLSLGSGSIVPRSSVLAKFGLTSFSDSRTLIDRLIKIATNAHECGNASQKNSLYFGVYRELVTFGVLQAMLPEKGKRDALIRFYENMKNLRSAKNHPHFWLQYALARLAQDNPEDLERAKFYIDSAYSHARNIPNYHTNHLDTVNAKYLIKHGANMPDINQALKELGEAHATLLKQVRTEKTEAPYSAAKEYLAFYNSQKKSLDATQKAYLVKICNQILENIPHLDLDLQTEKHIRFCKADLESLISDVNKSAVN